MTVFEQNMLAAEDSLYDDFKAAKAHFTIAQQNMTIAQMFLRYILDVGQMPLTDYVSANSFSGSSSLYIRSIYT